MRKKMLATILTGVFLLSNTLVVSAQSLVTPEQSSSDESRIVETTIYNVETDVQKLYERAKRGISDDLTPKELTKGKAILKDSNGNGNKEINSIHTTQLIKTEKKANDAIVNTYATTSFVELKDKDLEVQKTTNSGTFSIMGTGTWYDQGYGETSYSVLGYDTLVYEKVTVSSAVSKYRILRTYGGFNIVGGTGISINWQTIKSSATGTQDNGQLPAFIDYGTSYPYGQMTFDISYPNNGYVYEFDGGFWKRILKTELSCNVYRGTDSWYFVWANEY